MARGAGLLVVAVALAIAAVVLVAGEGTDDAGDVTSSTETVTRRTVNTAHNRALTRLAAEDLVRNFRDHGNRNVRGTHVHCRAAGGGGWQCSYVVEGKTCAAAVSGTFDDPETTVFCDSEGNKL